MNGILSIENNVGLESESPLPDAEHKTSKGAAKLPKQSHQYNAVINSIRLFEKGDKKMYFVCLGLFSGREDDGAGRHRNFIQNVELLVSSQLEKWAMLMVAVGGLPTGYDKLIHEVEVSGLQFTAVVSDGKPYINTRGFLESIKLG